MKRIHSHSDERLELSEFIRRCDEKIVSQRADISAAAEDLAALARNKSHLTSLLANILSERVESAENASSLRYSDQCQILVRRPQYYVRIAAWDVPRQRGDSFKYDERYFSYGFVHNHNFDLLTAGIYGPGYISVSWRLEIPVQYLSSGRPVKLVKVPDERLRDGDVLLYERWHDVHMQQPPESFSMSLNLIVEDFNVPQYSFDPTQKTAVEHIGGAGHGIAGLFAIARALNHPDIEVLNEMARRKLGERVFEELILPQTGSNDAIR
ncbi:MAG TPA: hypothetical protein PKC97_11280 [Burkholderiaceae bacterium]|nr:hypothetical protein [Burkholderiaceae bacterium]